jgi:hypothetical protein
MPLLDPGSLGSTSSKVDVHEAPFVRCGRFRCAGLIVIDRLGVALG